MVKRRRAKFGPSCAEMRTWLVVSFPAATFLASTSFACLTGITTSNYIHVSAAFGQQVRVQRLLEIATFALVSIQSRRTLDLLDQRLARNDIMVSPYSSARVCMLAGWATARLAKSLSQAAAWLWAGVRESGYVEAWGARLGGESRLSFASTGWGTGTK